jgi:hypothetical protein
MAKNMQILTKPTSREDALGAIGGYYPTLEGEKIAGRCHCGLSFGTLGGWATSKTAFELGGGQ